MRALVITAVTVAVQASATFRPVEPVDATQAIPDAFASYQVVALG